MEQRGKNHPYWQRCGKAEYASHFAAERKRGWAATARAEEAKKKDQAERDRILGPEAPRLKMSRTRPAREQ